nr:MAG TPA: hypothetical protein [Caudoviricetes sp.]
MPICSKEKSFSLEGLFSPRSHFPHISRETPHFLAISAWFSPNFFLSSFNRLPKR